MTTSDPRDEYRPYVAFLRQSVHFAAGMMYLHAAHAAALEQPHSALGTEFKKLEGALAPNQLTPVQFFAAQLFVARIASFEVFLQETAALVIRKNPKKVGGATFALSELLDAGGTESLVQRASEEALNKLMYKKPLDYMNGLCELLSIESNRLSPSWVIFIEAKARRDLGLHNAWRCNQIYLRKVAEAGLRGSVKVGDSMYPTEAEYLHQTSYSLDWLATETTRLVLGKHWPDLVGEFSEMVGDDA